MACRRRHGITRSSTFKEEIYHDDKTTPSPSSSLAAQAIRASAAAHRDSSLSTVYADDSAFHSSFKYRSKTSAAKEYASMRSTSESGGFWGVLARKAKIILDDDNISGFESPRWPQKQQMLESSFDDDHLDRSPDSASKTDSPALRKGLDALQSSLNHIGDTIGNALEEGRSVMENKTAEIIQETRNMQIRRKAGLNNLDEYNNPWQELSAHSQTDQETQLKASRDVARATAAKAKQLLRELKTVKADLAFAKERCSQLEEENRVLREAYEKGDYPVDDDDMIRLQLETLLAEKARLAHENSIYARENCVLREIVEYHQLTMQDVVYLDEGFEEVTEVYPAVSVSPPISPRCSSNKFSPSTSPLRAKTTFSKTIKDQDASLSTDQLPTSSLTLSISAPDQPTTKQ